MTQPAAWSLSAPESYVLLHGADADAREVFKLALTELIARGALVLEEERGGWRGRTRPIVRDGPRATSPRERPLAAAWEVYRSSQRDGEGVLERVDRQLEVAGQQVPGAAGQQAQGHPGPDELLGDGAHRAVPAERADEVDAALDGLPGLAEADVVLGGLEDERLGPVVRRADLLEPAADGWPTVILRFDVEEEACRYVLGCGAAIEVVAPRSLRELVMARAAEVVAFYAERSADARDCAGRQGERGNGTGAADPGGPTV